MPYWGSASSESRLGLYSDAMAFQHGLIGPYRRVVVALSLVGLIVTACSGAGGSEPSSPTTGVDDERSVTAATAASSATTAPPSTVPVTSTVPPPPAPDLPGLPEFTDAPMRPDPEWITGQLNNGLHYYLRQNDSPVGRTSLRLAIRAGSVDEFGSSTGVAHFVEHMLFNGTERFPKNDLVSALRSFGIGFGADINAYTSFDETVYRLEVPTDPESIKLGIEVLAEWLDRGTFDQDQVEAERGVILDEWRVHTQDADGRLFGKAIDMLFEGTAYAGRRPIGDDTSISNVTRDELFEFYKAYYRPDNAAVIIVGDYVDMPVGTWLDEHFGGITNPAEPLRPGADTTPQTDTTPDVVRHLDPDSETGDIEVMFPFPTTDGKDRANLTAEIFDDLIFDIIADRLDRDSVVGDAAFYDVDYFQNWFVDRVRGYGVSVSAKPADTDSALVAVLDEFERAARFGFDPSEVDVAVQVARAWWDAYLSEAASKRDEDFASDAVANFLIGDPYPTVEIEYQVATAALDQVTAEALNQRFWARWANSAPHIIISGPESAGDVLPTTERALNLVAGLRARDLVAREPLADLPDALMEPPAPVEASTDVDISSYDSRYARRVWTYPNGITLIAAEHYDDAGALHILAGSPGGSSLVADADLPAAHFVADVVTKGGIGEFNRSEVDRILAGADITTGARLEPYYEYLWAEGAMADAEAAFQLLNRYLTEPRFDQVALDRVLQDEESIVADPTIEPGRAAEDALADLRYGDDIRHTKILTPDEFNTVDLDGIERVWRERFRPDDDWVIVVHGDVDMEVIGELGKRYLGSLPSAHPDPASPNVTAEPPEGVAAAIVKAGTGDTASISLTFTSPIDDVTGKLRATADVVSDLVSDRLVSVVREEFGATYSPTVEVTFGVDPTPVITTTIVVTAAPDRVTDVADAVIAQITELATAGPSPEELSRSLAVVGQRYGWKGVDEIVHDILADSIWPTMDLDDYVLTNRPFEAWGIGAEEVQRFVTDHVDLANYVRVDQVPR
ncbi:MAG: hypothetical protein CSA55_03010 [Ilumatobacter coccineus]|uniref:Insulinase family protein n=1 Tax=Ilumatobacter coccineus TaxID=467094 RepID=A0A2G6KAN7_9ACTN|nr:MAG: hypothetical protein CSA55_03010 [Ilumatobacter coccineus]